MTHEHGVLATLADVEAIETVPLEERLAIRDTYQLLAAAARAHGPRPALIFVANGAITDRPTTITYRQLFANITRAANMFTALGVGPGDVVSYMLPNLPQTHYTIWGAQAAGIVNAVNPFLEVAQIADILKAANTKVLVTLGPGPDRDIWDKAVAAARLVPSVETILQVEGDRLDSPQGGAKVQDFDHLLAQQPGDRLTAARTIAPDDTAAFFHTGGTTGSPKLARHSHWGEVYQAWSIGCIGNYAPGEVFLCGLPLFHVNAVIVTGLGAFMAGMTVLLPGPDGYRNPVLLRDFWKIVERYRVTTFSGVPTLYARLIASPIGDADISSLKVVVCGAAPMPVALFKEFEKVTGVSIREGYGLTEGTCVSAVNPRDGEKRIGSIGLRLPYQQMKVVRLGASGKYAGDCAVGEIGVIAIKGPNTTPGYQQEAFNDALFLGDGWLNTGDLGRQDGDGYFWLTGRAKDLIIRGGHNIDPAVIEETLTTHPAVDLVAAVGQPDSDVGELPVAYVTLKPGATAAADDLRAFAKANIAERAAAPVAVHILETMPETAVGKIFKPPLRHDATARVLRQALASADIDAGIGAEVTVGADEVKGTLAKIKIPASESQAMGQAVAKALGGFATSYEIIWAGAPGEPS